MKLRSPTISRNRKFPGGVEFRVFVEDSSSDIVGGDSEYCGNLTTNDIENYGLREMFDGCYFCLLIFRRTTKKGIES